MPANCSAPKSKAGMLVDHVIWNDPRPVSFLPRLQQALSGLARLGRALSEAKVGVRPKWV
jgi:hypothetical protein